MKWAELKSFQGKYKNQLEISDVGLARKNGKLCKLSKNRYGYLYITNCCKKYYIHRLVAMAFIPNSEKKSQVNHKNGIKHDNRVENLEWATQSENVLHAIKTGLRTRFRGGQRINGVVCVETGVYYRSTLEAERYTGIHHTGIILCIHKKNKTAGGFHWRSANE